MNLLVVDDEYYIVHHIATTLNKERVGIDTIFSAYSSEQAKRIILTQQVDMLVTDIEMPHGSGLELIQWIKEQGLYIITLILTGHQRFDYAQKAIAMQCFGYILKPVHISSLENELIKAARNIAPAPLLGTSSAIPSQEAEDDFVEKTREYIRENLPTCELSRSALAAHVHMNPDYLSYLFHQKFGQTLSSYINSARMDAAKELLLYTNLSMTEISERSGFSNCSYFFKQFKRATGVTPQQFREQHGRFSK